MRVSPRTGREQSVQRRAAITVNGPESNNGLSVTFAALSVRLWARVRKTGTCWIWTGARTGSGSVRHGQIAWQGKPRRVHRLVWELLRGPIPSGQQINHHCDNPICVNPEHLYLGTQAENMRDAARRTRFTVPRTTTKLSLYDRLTIYKTPAYRGVCVALARRYGVTKACISVIRRGRFLGSGVWAGVVRIKESA